LAAPASPICLTHAPEPGHGLLCNSTPPLSCRRFTNEPSDPIIFGLSHRPEDCTGLRCRRSRCLHSPHCLLDPAYVVVCLTRFYRQVFLPARPITDDPKTLAVRYYTI
jgi:hypothetical protein